MKKTLKSVCVMLAACAMCFSFSACGGDDDPWSDLLNGGGIITPTNPTTTSSATLDGTKISFAAPQKMTSDDQICVIFADSGNKHNLTFWFDESFLGESIDLSVVNEKSWIVTYSTSTSGLDFTAVFNRYSYALLGQQFEEGSYCKFTISGQKLVADYKLIYKDSEDATHTMKGSYSGSFYNLDNYATLNNKVRVWKSKSI